MVDAVKYSKWMILYSSEFILRCFGLKTNRLFVKQRWRFQGFHLHLLKLLIIKKSLFTIFQDWKFGSDIDTMHFSEYQFQSFTVWFYIFSFIVIIIIVAILLNCGCILKDVYIYIYIPLCSTFFHYNYPLPSLVFIHRTDGHLFYLFSLSLLRMSSTSVPWSFLFLANISVNHPFLKFVFTQLNLVLLFEQIVIKFTKKTVQQCKTYTQHLLKTQNRQNRLTWTSMLTIAKYITPMYIYSQGQGHNKV